jgi:hypothetical protein
MENSPSKPANPHIELALPDSGPQEILCPLAQLSAELDKLRDQGWRPVSLEYLGGRMRGQARLIAIREVSTNPQRP